MVSIVLGELSYGFIEGKRKDFNARQLRRFISRLKVEIVPVDIVRRSKNA